MLEYVPGQSLFGDMGITVLHSIGWGDVIEGAKEKKEREKKEKANIWLCKRETRLGLSVN